MGTVTPDQSVSSRGRPTANDRLKRSFDTWSWRSISLAVVVHFAALALWPAMQSDDWGLQAEEPRVLDVTFEAPLPPPPDEIPRPAVPAINPDLSPDAPFFEMDERTFEEPLPAPPTRRADAGGEPRWTPYEVAPEMRNRAEFERSLARAYPTALRDAGVGGTVVVWVPIDAEGQVTDARVQDSSGHDRLDEAALGVLPQARFTPALNRDERVPVWVQFPVVFQSP